MYPIIIIKETRKIKKQMIGYFNKCHNLKIFRKVKDIKTYYRKL